MFRYAQINKNGVVTSDSQLSREVISENMIPIDNDFDLTNKKYNIETKEWESYTQLEPQELESTQEEVQAQTLLNTEYLVIMSEI